MADPKEYHLKQRKHYDAGGSSLGLGMVPGGGEINESPLQAGSHLHRCVHC